jgi:prepilin-type N-terminal cleavage/methylation domain-containing protein
MNRSRKSAFTLIELLIVVGIVAILALVAIPNLLHAQVRAKVSRAKADMRTLATAMEAYAVDTHHYPPDFDSNIYPGVTVQDESLTYAQLTTPVAFITSVPLDPFRQGLSTTRGGYFEYYGVDAQPYYSTPANIEAWKQKNTRWFMYSLGPDKQNDRLPANLDGPEDYCYDPTNGTVSIGDFGRSNAQVSVP